MPKEIGNAAIPKPDAAAYGFVLIEPLFDEGSRLKANSAHCPDWGTRLLQEPGGSGYFRRA